MFLSSYSILLIGIICDFVMEKPMTSIKRKKKLLMFDSILAKVRRYVILDLEVWLLATCFLSLNASKLRDRKVPTEY